MIDRIPVIAASRRPVLAMLLLLTGPTLLRADPPANDARAGAIPIFPVQPTAGTLEEATMEEGETLPPGFERSVWYSWTASAPGPWEARITSAHGQTGLTVYEAAAGGVLHRMAQSAFARS